MYSKMRPLLLLLCCATAAAFVAPTGHRRPRPLRSSQNPVPPEDKPNRPPGIDPAQLPDASTADGVAQILEVTFVKACMQLSTGYVDTLKLFIATALTAYERGFTVSALNLELAQCPAQTAGRPLMQEEVELRSVWVCLVYLTLANVQHKSDAPEAVGASVPAEIRQKFQTFVYDVVNAQRGGFTLESLKLEEMLRRQGTAAEGLSAVEKAILGPSMRVIFLTLTVRDEAEAAGNLPPPRKPGPSIPGAPSGFDP